MEEEAYLDVDGAAWTEEERAQSRWRAPPTRHQQCWTTTHSRRTGSTSTLTAKERTEEEVVVAKGRRSEKDTARTEKETVGCTNFF